MKKYKEKKGNCEGKKPLEIFVTEIVGERGIRLALVDLALHLLGSKFQDEENMGKYRKKKENLEMS